MHPETPFSLAEVVHAVDNEMARSLEDVLRRRMPLTLLVKPEGRCPPAAARLVAERLGWSEAEREARVAAFVDASGRPAENAP